MTDLGWKPDRNSKGPLYTQIKQFIIGKITSGEWYVHYRLPPQRKLAEDFGVNRSTIKAALEDLTADGILETRGKAGTYVQNNTWSVLSSNLSPDWKTYIDAGSLNVNRKITQKIYQYEFSTNLIRLSTGELSPELVPKKAIDKVLAELGEKADYELKYEHQNGSLDLRREICNYYKELDMNVSPEQVLLVSGGIQAIHLISMGLLPRGASIICEKPSYLASLNIFESSGVYLKGVNIGVGGINMPELEKIYYKSHSPICYLIPYFQNPTGNSINDRNRKRLTDFCRENRIPIVEDDSYRELYFDDMRRMPLKSDDENQSIIHVGTVSKTISGGMRLGWMIGQEEIINKLADLKMQMDYGVGTLSQVVFYKLLKSGFYREHIRLLRQKLKKRCEFMNEVLKRDFSGIAEWNVPDGGFYIWLSVLPAIKMCDVFSYCADHGVLINPGYTYDSENTSDIRLSFAYADLEDIEKGLPVLKEAILHCAKGKP